jgi:hypothetical protein
MSSNYVAAFNATTGDHWRDPGSYTGTYMTLIGTVAFFPALALFYLIWNAVFHLCQSLICRSTGNDPWLKRTKQKFLNWFHPFSIVLHFCTSLASACFFLYLVVHVNRKFTEGKSREDLVAIFQSRWLVWLEFGLCFVDVLYVTFRFFTIKRKWDILLSLDAILSILVSVSGIVAPFIGFYYWGFMSLRFAQLASVLGTVGKMHWKIFSGLIAQMVVMVAFFFSLVFSVTGLIFTYENVYFTGGLLTNYFVALYMVGITLTTVGYGDFYPISRAGRIVIILGVLSAFWMVPPLIAAVLEPWRKYYASRKYSGDGHAVIFSRSENVSTVVTQFYRARKTVAENLLLMTESTGSEELRTFLRSEFLRLRVTHFFGNWSDPAIVKRARPTKAHYCLLVQDKFNDDPEEADANMIGGALAVMRVAKSVPMFVQLNSSARRFAFDYNHENILGMDDLRRGLLVQNCTAPGVLSVLSNLVIAKSGPPKNYKHHWLSNYKAGLYGHFETDIPLDSVVGHSWANVCKALHALFSITFVSVWHAESGLRLFPLIYTIEDDAVGQFITTGSRKSISDALASDSLQKYLLMLQASTNFDDIDHMKALSLADMVESEDAEIVKKFNLFQRSNLSDILARSASSRASSIEKAAESIKHHKETSFKPNSVNSPSAPVQASPSPQSARLSISKGSSWKPPSQKSNSTGQLQDDDQDSLGSSSSMGSHSSFHGTLSSDSEESAESHKKAGIKEARAEENLEVVQTSVEAKDDPEMIPRSRVGAQVDMGEGEADWKAETALDPFLATLVSASEVINEDHVHFEEEEEAGKWDQIAAKRRSLEGKLSKHVVVFGRAGEMMTSIGRRLLRRTPVQQNIVLAVSHVSSASQKVIQQLTSLSNVERIDVLIGSPVNPTDLTRAAAPSARVCLVLPDALNLSSAAVQASQDSNMLIAYHLLRQTSAFPIIELMNPDNEQLMMNDEDGHAKLATAGGNIFKRSLFDNILTQAVFKPHFIPLFESLSDATISHLAIAKKILPLSPQFSSVKSSPTS